MKRNQLLGLALVLLLASLASFVLAQQTSPLLRSSKLQAAVALLDVGNPQEARAVIARIPTHDPEHSVARFYDASAQYDTQDKLGFLKAMETLKTNPTVIPTELKQALAVKQMDALFHYRQFEELLPQVRVFAKTHAGAPEAQTATEYQMAALLERGMKKAVEASTMAESQSQQQWAGGKTNLEEFLALAESFSNTNYNRLKKRNLQEDIWTARITLGDETAAAEELANGDAASRERFNLLRVQLYQKLQPERTERNLQMMKDFLKEFPESQSRKRVEFDTASLSFSLGEKLCKEAEASEQATGKQVSGEKRTLASGHFELFRSLQSQAEVDKASGIEASDVLDLRGDLLYSYFLEKKFGLLSSEIERLLTEAKPGDLKWVVAKVYQGILLQSQTPPQTREAAAVFDEVLALDFNGRPDHDYHLLLAAKWRVHVANFSKDPAKARELVRWVQDGSCRKDLKAKFLKDYEGLLLAPQSNQSK